MECKHLSDHLVDYLYQGLDAEQASQVEGHLEQCEGCARDLADVKSTRQLMQQLPSLDPPVEISERLMKEAILAVQPGAPSFWERLRGGLRVMVLHPATATAVIMVVVAGIGFYAYQRTSPVATRPIADEIGPVDDPAGPALVREYGAHDDRTTVGDDPSNKKETAFKQASVSSSTDKARLANQAASDPARDPKAARPRLASGLRSATRARQRPGPMKRRRRKAPAMHRKAGEAAPAVQVAFKGKDEQEGGALGGGQPRPTPAVTKSPRPPKTRPVKPGGADSGGANYHLRQAALASKRGMCDRALSHYNSALALRPALRKKIALGVMSCARSLARQGEARLVKARNRNPRLAGMLDRELSRVRAAAKPAKKSGGQKVRARPAKRSAFE